MGCRVWILIINLNFMSELSAFNEIRCKMKIEKLNVKRLQANTSLLTFRFSLLAYADRCGLIDES